MVMSMISNNKRDVIEIVKIYQENVKIVKTQLLFYTRTNANKNHIIEYLLL